MQQPMFLSHGAPTLALALSPGEDKVQAFMQGLGRTLQRPKSILAVSAHWETENPMAAETDRPQTIHDFGGFPPELYRIVYPAPGAPALAHRVAGLLLEAGFAAGTDPSWGLDHGAWVPLMNLFPEADVPVAQLSIQTHLGARHHLAVGRALAPLKSDGVLVMGSGGAVHNLRRLARPGGNGPEPWAQEFEDWLAEALALGRIDEVVDFEVKAPHGRMAHPRPEHFYPLLVALGAAGEGARGTALYRGFTHGNLSLASFRFAGASG
ncbi:MAG: dioxygenase [Proteobacteria bacterium]|nr:dioxygenase [Pseudomonadota bacterium]MBI3497769.1 dioxygenase [Pseudomonadota bacterium]